MARGWESKSVESQQEAADSAPERRVPLTAIQQKVQALHLSRKRVLDEIAASSSPRFKELKQRAIHHLDKEIARLQESETQE